jgi:hypothetical protein
VHGGPSLSATQPAPAARALTPLCCPIKRRNAKRGIAPLGLGSGNGVDRVVQMTVTSFRGRQEALEQPQFGLTPISGLKRDTLSIWRNLKEPVNSPKPVESLWRAAA